MNAFREYVNMRKSKPNTEYYSQNHCKYLLPYHIILVCKYRKKLLKKYGNDIKQIMYDISEKYDFSIITMEVDKDHIHIMIDASPKVSPLQIIRVLKQQSTIKIWRIYKKELLKEFWKEHTFWTDRYFCSIVGEVSSKTLKQYIQNQG